MPVGLHDACFVIWLPKAGGRHASKSRKSGLDNKTCLMLFHSRPYLNRHSYKLGRQASPNTVTNSDERGLFPGALEMMVLRSLKRQPLHGYALVQHIKRTSDDLLQIEEGSLYPALQRLLKEGLVKAKWGISSTNRRVRIYELTPAGAKHLEREVSKFERMLKGVTRVLALGES